MLDNDDRILENIEVKEVKTPSPLSSADRSINEDEENTGSDSSSGGSSPSDLKKRLQHHPSPNEVTRLASRVINISRRLSRKRDFYFHETNNRIEENEETEEQETIFPKRSFGDFKAKDARVRRRAKIHLENETNRNMVVSNPSEISTSDLQDNSVNSNSQTSNRSSVIENKVKGMSEKYSVQHPSVEIEMLTNNTQRHSSLSARLYRNQQEETNNDSSRSQKNVFHHIYPDTSSENLPKNRIELQPISPISLKSSLHNKYRPCRGVILQNLSSGSEADSNFEVMSDRIGSSHKIDRLMRLTPQETNISPNLCSNNLEIQNLNDTLSLSSERSSNQTLINSSRNDYLENVSSLVPRMDFTGSKLQQGLNKPFVPLASLRKTPRERSFYRKLSSSRSDCGQNMKETVDEPMFFSARQEIHDYNKECLQTPRSVFETPIYPNMPTNILENEISKTLSNNMVNFGENIYNENVKQSSEKIFDQNEQEIIAKEYINSPNLKFYENQTFITCEKISNENTNREKIHYQNKREIVANEYFNPSQNKNCTSTPKSVASPETIVQNSIFGNDSNNNSELSSNLKNITSPPFKSNASEDQSTASSFREFFVSDFTKLSQNGENCCSPQSIMNSQGTHNSHGSKIVNSQEFINVPTLVLNSREISYSTSPNSKICSERHLDSNALIIALSNASLKQQTAKDVFENTCSESCTDSKAVFRLESSENNLSMDVRFSKSDENRSKLTTSTTSCRSSLSIKSKIPIKIPSNRSKLSIRSKFNESDKGLISPRNSSTQTFRSNSSSLENLQFVSTSHENSPFMKNYAIMSESSTKIESQEQEKYFNLDSIKNESDSMEKSNVILEDAQSKTAREENQDYESSINRPTIDTFRPLNFSDNPKKSEKKNEQNILEQNISSEDESETSSPYDTRESVKEIEEPEGSKEFNTFSPRNVSTSFPLESYRDKHINNTYEGECFEKITEERKTNLFENQIGDGGCQEFLIEDSEKFKSLNTSAEDEELIKPRKVTDKLRFSLEKLAVEQIRKNLNSEQTRTIQSDTTAFFTEKFYEIPQFTLAGSSSMSKLRYDKSRDSPRFKKKSQDRFPFTISEKTSIASMKFKVPGRLGNLDEDEEDRRYRLDTHPSITRLAGYALEDSPAEIISYMVQTELENRYLKSSGMKGLVNKISARWKRPKRCGNGIGPTKVTSVIYKNRDYQEECESSNCSESSSLQEFKIYESLEGKLCNPEPSPDSPDEKRYDRDDLWVQAFKNSNHEKGKKNVEIADEVDEDKLKNPYSVFFVKSVQGTPETSTKAFVPKNEKQKQDVSIEKRKNRTKYISKINNKSHDK
ncbi:uncharacterized protein LOC132907112 [Bombus pascuorum]|uniref:uncharacterized protein LOC132907112 n=1 Tax=Bombus pascuorum TaxID=65598 RepID=UPI00298E88BB|nr:uncharacterized protein LOC132907112 [Bombus pascuorum]